MVSGDREEITLARLRQLASEAGDLRRLDQTPMLLTLIDGYVQLTFLHYRVTIPAEDRSHDCCAACRRVWPCGTAQIIEQVISILAAQLPGPEDQAGDEPGSPARERAPQPAQPENRVPPWVEQASGPGWPA